MIPLPCHIGEVVTFEAHGHTFAVKRLRRDCWHLRRLDILTRSRFGTAREIRADIKAALDFGILECSGERW